MQTSELIIQPATTTRDTVIVGAVAGIAAGVAMSFWAVLTSIWHGVGLLSSFELIGATFMGSGAVSTGLGMILYGFVVHTLMSAALGVLFTLLLPKTISCGQACAAGVAYGLAVMLAMTFVITPLVNPVMREAVTLLPKSWLIQHALFGVALGLVPLLWRQCGDEAVRVRVSSPAVNSLVTPRPVPAHKNTVAGHHLSRVAKGSLTLRALRRHAVGSESVERRSARLTPLRSQ